MAKTASTAPILTTAQLGRATLARQMLLAREPIGLLEAVERLLALQAQLARPPFVALWSRVEGFTRADLVSALDLRTIVRATFVRATLHLVSARDYLRLRASLQPGLDAGLATILKGRLDDLDLASALKDAHAFFAAQARTFDDLRDHVLAADSAADARAVAYAVRLRLPLVQVPEPGTDWAFPGHAAFAPADRWLKRRVGIAPEPADDLVLRYLAAYGPASVADVQAWTGLKLSPDVLVRLRPQLAIFRDQKHRELLDLPDAPRPPGDTPAPVRFLPDYDSAIVARADERFVAKADRPRVFLPGLRIAPTVLVNGVVAGVWDVTTTRTAVTLGVTPFGPLSASAQQDVRAEGERLARFLEPSRAVAECRLR